MLLFPSHNPTGIAFVASFIRVMQSAKQLIMKNKRFLQQLFQTQCIYNNTSVKLHVQPRWCNNSVMSSNPTQLPPLLESVTQIQTRNLTIHQEPKRCCGASDGVLLGGAGSSPRGSVCMDSSRFPTIQLGAQRKQRGGGTEPGRHVSVRWCLQKQTTGVAPVEGVMIGGRV